MCSLFFASLYFYPVYFCFARVLLFSRPYLFVDRWICLCFTRFVCRLSRIWPLPVSVFFFFCTEYMSTLQQLCSKVCIWVQPFLEPLAQLWQTGREVTAEKPSCPCIMDSSACHETFCGICIMQTWQFLFLFVCFLLNFTNNNWHLKSPQGSAASCQRECHYRNQCVRTCVIKSFSVSYNNRLKAANDARLPVCAPV